MHDLNPVLWQITEALAVRWYGLAYLAGFAIGWWLLARYHRAGLSPLDARQRETAVFAIIIGTLLGGRLGYVLLYRPEMLQNPGSILAVWDGGMAAHGAMVGIPLALWWLARAVRAPFLRLADIVCTLAPPGILLGRLANFVNGELWGKPSDAPWAVVFPREAVERGWLEAGAAPDPAVIALLPARHPSQLYAAALEGLALGLYLQLRFWLAGRRLPAGQIAGEFLVAYAVVRSLGEVYREPDAALILGLSRGTFYSVIAAAAGVALIVWVKARAAARSGPPPEGDS